MCVSAKLQWNRNLWHASNWAVHAHWRSLGPSLLMHCVPPCCSKLLSLCCITEGTELLLDLDTCLHGKMLGYKLRAFSEMLQYKTGKTHCHISEREGSFMRFWVFLHSINVTLIFMKKYHVVEKSETVLTIWVSQISWQKKLHIYQITNHL